MSFLTEWDLSLHDLNKKEGPKLLKRAKGIQHPGQSPSIRVCLANFWWRLKTFDPEYFNVQKKFDPQQEFLPWAIEELRGVVLESRFAAGDRGVIEELFRRNSAWLLEEAKKILKAGTYYDPEDICQEVFLKLLEGRNNYDAKRPFRPWLKTILRNHISSRTRSRLGWLLSRFVRDPKTEKDRLVQDSDSSTLGVGIDEKLKSALVGCLKALRDPDRDLITDIFINGLKSKEIGINLSLNKSTISRRKTHVLSVLRGCLKKKGVDLE